MGEYLSSFSSTVWNGFPAFRLSAVSQCDKGLLGVRAAVSQETHLGTPAASCTCTTLMLIFCTHEHSCTQTQSDSVQSRAHRGTSWVSFKKGASSCHVLCQVCSFLWFNTLNWRLQQATACWQQQELIYNISVNAQHLKSIVITQNAVHRSDSPYAGLDSSHHKHVTLTAITSQSVKPPAEGQRWNLSRFSAGSTFSQPTKKQR